MLEKFSQIAEQAATNASRRQFLGRLGKGALTAAAVVSGVLTSEAALTRRPPRRPRACGEGSDIYCRGLVEGAYCQIGTTAGTCVGASACSCRPASGPRGGRGGRTRRAIHGRGLRLRRRRNKED
jgi:hypothetical protein